MGIIMATIANLAFSALIILFPISARKGTETIMKNSVAGFIMGPLQQKK
jgi:hypothetical protein